MQTETATDLLEMYRLAVEQNMDSQKLRIFPTQVIVQLLPDVYARGGIILPKKPKALGTRRIWCRYGTVIKLGEDVDAVELRDIVIFSNMLGIRFRGTDNPLKLAGVIHSDDEVRFMQCGFDFTEIWGVWEPTHIGATVRFRSPSTGEIHEVEVLDESPVYGGYLKADQDGKDLWVPYRWLVDASE